MTGSYIHPDAKLGNGVTVGNFSSIAANVEIGEGTTIGNNVVIHEYVKIGRNCRIASGAILGCEPQDVGYNGEKTWLEIGDNNSIFEFVTMARGTVKGRGKTVVGNDCMIMAYAHIAHDCIVGNNVVLVSFVALAGFVEVGDFANIGGQTGVHQFSRIGAYSMIAAAATVVKDVPPYVLVGRAPVAFYNLNLVGLRRNGFSREQIDNIAAVYGVIYKSGYNTSDACAKAEQELPDSPERNNILDFIRSSKRGIIKSASKSAND